MKSAFLIYEEEPELNSLVESRDRGATKTGIVIELSYDHVPGAQSWDCKVKWQDADLKSQWVRVFKKSAGEIP